MTGCRKSGAALGSALFPPTKIRRTNETLQQAYNGIKKIYFER